MRVAIAGSRRLPAGQAVKVLCSHLAALPDGSVVHLRRAIATPINPFEVDVAKLCALFGIDVQWFVPAPNAKTPGRASVYRRDYDMVDSADLVLVFLAVGDEEGYTGTGHVQDAALASDRPVYSYVVDDDGSVTRRGEYDPDEQYAALVPGP